jgi:hypothetical protein
MKQWVFGLAVVCALGGCSGAEENKAAGGNAAAQAPAQPAGKRFVNNPNNNFPADLKEKYTDFSFSYPQEWREEIEPTGSNFVQVSAPVAGELQPYVFAVGPATATGNAEVDKPLLRQLLPQLEQQFAQSFQNFAVDWRGEQRLGRYETMSIGFTGQAPGPQGPIDAAGRIDVIVPPGSQRGVTTISVAFDRGQGKPTPLGLAQAEPFRGIYDSLQLGK